MPAAPPTLVNLFGPEQAPAPEHLWVMRWPVRDLYRPKRLYRFAQETRRLGIRLAWQVRNLNPPTLSFYFTLEQLVALQSWLDAEFPEAR